MPNVTTCKIYDYATGVFQYLPNHMMLPVGEAGSDSILLLSGTSTVNEWYDLLGGNFKLSYRAANGNIVIIDDRELITALDVHSLKSHSKPTLQWFQPFVWHIDHEHDHSRKSGVLFGQEVRDTSVYGKKVGKPRNGLFTLVNKEILPAAFAEELFFAGAAQHPKTHSANKEAIFTAITAINTRSTSSYGRVAYEILHDLIPFEVSLNGYI